ncbi:cytochrome P450 [Dendryphion nanum]|uniref:Cytochrome P450 n=1 Tax=Dendryphion nanum TaxID=256645 RepID=A0A9P9D9Q9_9PLEO|nr:cytochrome P450 [Dendryphion nanum]
MSYLGAILSLCAFYVVFWCLRALYRLTLHPLAKWPGSKLAAVSTEWYEWYWNMRREGELLHEIERLHKIHGPVIRIGANELHVNDPDFYLSITNVSSSFHKEPEFYRQISLPGTSIGETDPNSHRIRRAVIAPSFSAAHVLKVHAPLIQEKLRQLCDLIDQNTTSGTPVNIKRAFKSLTLDVISKIVFGEEFGVLKSLNASHPYLDMLQETLKGGWISRAFPNVSATMMALPETIAERLFSIPILVFVRNCGANVDTYLKKRESNSNAKGTSDVLERLLDPTSAKGHRVPTSKELTDEALMLLTAGNDTVSNAMILGLYEVLSAPAVQAEMVSEIVAANPNLGEELGYEQVRSLSYVTAVVKEIIRFTNPIPGRLPRVVPPQGYQLHGKFLPPGTVVHTSAYLLNRHPSVWGDDGHEFKPSRWLAEDTINLDKYMASFQRGSRQCLGIHMAWCELTLVLTTLLRRYELQVHDTSRKDMEWKDHLLMLFQGKDFHVMAKRRV